MGLDMYLSAKKFVSSYSFQEAGENEAYDRVINAVGANDIVSPDTHHAEVSVNVAYWRKANAIHNWFVTNCQDGNDDCGEYYVSREQLIVLRDTCKQVLEDSALATELLPPQEGFFFGNTDIDEYYLYSVQETYDRISALLDKTDDDEYKDWSFEYHSSW